MVILSGLVDLLLLGCLLICVGIVFTTFLELVR
jgi:hypothetical protein